MTVDEHDPTELYRIRDGVYAADLLIAAVTEFDLFSWLDRHGPVGAAVLRTELGLAERPADVLLTYCAARNLVDRDLSRGDRIELTGLARRHLVAGSGYDLRAYFGSLAERPAVRELAEVLRTDQPAAWASARSNAGGEWSHRLGDVQFARRITAAMDARGAFLGPMMAQALDTVPITAVLDVGGGSGGYACAILDRRPAARAAVVERAPVDDAARTLLRERGWHDRVQVITADMFGGLLPEGYDVHLYSHVLHDWDATAVEHLMAASFTALPPGGWLIVHDAHIDADKRGSLPVAEYSVLLMHSTPGKCWSTTELDKIAHRVGFTDVAHRPMAADRSIVLARKPDS